MSVFYFFILSFFYLSSYGLSFRKAMEHIEPLVHNILTSPVVKKLADIFESWNQNIPHKHFTEFPADKGDEFHARWYLHPTQHAFEGIICLLVSIPIILHCLSVIKKNLQENKVEYKPTKTQYIWSIVLLSSLLFQLPVRLSKIEMASHPAFFLQPCHVSSIIFFFSTFFPSDSAFAWMHCTSLLTWGPSLAFCFPNFPATYYEVFFFYVQHVCLVTTPLFVIDKYHRPLYSSSAWNFASFWVLVLYHWWGLLPWSIFTGVNVATMMIPPPALKDTNEWYRLIMFTACLLLHTVSVIIHSGLGYVRESIEKKKK